MYFLLQVLIFLSVTIYIYFKWSFNYWNRRNVPTIPPSIPFGTYPNPLNRRETPYVTVRRYHEQLKRAGARHGGLFAGTHPIYLPVDTDLIKNILTRDFHYFMDRGVYHSARGDPISENIFTSDGDEWSKLRAKMTPVFTSGKIKAMFPTLVACGEQMMTFVDGVAKRGEPLDMKETFACYTTDVIGSCAFGIDCNCFVDPDSEFRKYCDILNYITKPKAVQLLVSIMCPGLIKALRARIISKNISKFFFDTVRTTVDYRQENNVRRNDFMQILIDMKNKENSLTMNEVTAQSFLFFMAGFETSSSSLNFCMLELAQHEDIQDRLREEIVEVLDRYDGKITYDSILEMKYLGQVFDEALRKHPVGATLYRRCIKDYKVPDTDIVIEKGTHINISVFALQHDPEYFPDPDKYDPERFSDENKHKIVPFTYLPFGLGPRSCLGLRFALMESKVSIIMLVKNYRITLNKKTELPTKLSPYSLFVSTDKKVWVDLEPIKK